jgi:predicted dienelactone hydrolase
VKEARTVPIRLFWLLLGLVLLQAGPVTAFEAGWQLMRIAGPTPDSPSTTVALYYPTQVASRRIPMGPFTPNVAPQAPPEAAVKGLIILSHGTGGSELGHTSIAEALARHGYLVAALRHPGDNWQDRSLLRGRSAR